MRELKFRAWDKVTKRYYAVSGLEYDDDGELCEVYLAGIQIDESDPYANVRRPSDVILEQYIGRKDKNGKRIYGGDIIRAEDIPKKTYEIFWDDDDLEVIIRDCHDRRWEIFQVPLEVIGNIHENPELVKEKE